MTTGTFVGLRRHHTQQFLLDDPLFIPRLILRSHPHGLERQGRLPVRPGILESCETQEIQGISEKNSPPPTTG